MVRFGDVTIAFVVVLVVILIIIPLPPALLDILIVVNISISLIILLTTLYTTEPLQFSTFPSIILIMTLFRLGLNVASTRLILGNNGDAGNVIATFGNFVIGGNVVVGIIIFLIIILIQFIVITRGSERVAEVAARFTLDAMPGKQMAIDADLNTGLINEMEAKNRRLKIQREADFFGSMDGASKFVKGDAILSILVTIVNSVGGIIIGAVAGNMPMDQVLHVYTLATVGDGLCSQLPALLISTATGIIVTRAASENNLGRDVFSQAMNQPIVMLLAGVALLFIDLIPGLPKIPILILGLTLVTVGVITLRRKERSEIESEEDHIEKMAQETRRPENVVSLLSVDPIELEFGYGIIPLADASQGGDLLDRVVMIRRQCAIELGMIVPVIRLRDNIQLEPSEYLIKIKGVEVARGEIMVDHYLAMNASQPLSVLNGVETIEPAFGLPAMWIVDADREFAENEGFTVVDTPSVIATHLTEILKKYGFELMGRQQVQTLLDNLRETQPTLVDDVVPRLITLGEVQKVLSNLLREQISIRDMATIIETLGDMAAITKDPDLLTEYVRQSLRRAITKRFIPDNKARVLTLEPRVETAIAENIKQSEQGSFVALEPTKLQAIFGSLKGAIDKMAALGLQPIVLTSPVVRMHFKRMTQQLAPDLVVLSYNELEQDVQIHADGVVSF